MLTIITGGRGCGKTTFLTHVAQVARVFDWDVAGIISPARIVEGRRVGIEAMDLRTEERRLLAHARTVAKTAGSEASAPLPHGRGSDSRDPAGRLTSPAWAFDEAVVAWGNAILQAATPCNMLIVDELGPLEFLHGQGLTAGLDAVCSGAYKYAFVVIRPELLRSARVRWPQARIVDISQR